jgi:hypothetical protein
VAMTYALHSLLICHAFKRIQSVFCYLLVGALKA